MRAFLIFYTSCGFFLTTCNICLPLFFPTLTANCFFSFCGLFSITYNKLRLFLLISATIYISLFFFLSQYKLWFIFNHLQYKPYKPFFPLLHINCNLFLTTCNTNLFIPLYQLQFIFNYLQYALSFYQLSIFNHFIHFLINNHLFIIFWYLFLINSFHL